MLHQGEMTYQMPIIYPDDDFRKEYTGEVKNSNIPHGQGTLTLKNGKEYSGNFSDGLISQIAHVMITHEAEWQSQLIEMKKRQQQKAEQLAAKKRRMLDEKLEYQRDNDPISLGTHEEGIQYLIENPVYFAKDWLSVVRNLGLIKKGKYQCNPYF